MWLKSLIQSSELKIVSPSERRKIISEFSLDWFTGLDINRLVLELLSWRDIKYVNFFLEKLRKELLISESISWDLSFSDFWQKLYPIRIFFDKLSYTYYLESTNSEHSIYLSDIITPDHIYNIVDIECFGSMINSAVCRDTNSYNHQILTDAQNIEIPFMLVEINSEIVGHIKLKWEKTFLSYVNAKDKNWNITLIKGGIYSIWKIYENIITENRIDDFDKHNYIISLDKLSIDFEEISKFWYFSKKLEWHLERIWEKENIYIK